MRSPWPCTGRSRSSRPSSRLAALIALTALSAPGLGAYQRTATRERLGKASFSSASPLPVSSSTLKLMPVTLPPGRERLVTRPLFKGSAIWVMTIGIVTVAFLAACTAVRLMPPNYVKAYLKRSKNDANDAAAICEAVTRPSMRFVAIKTREQQAAVMLHRARQLLVRQRTMLSNAIRGHLSELGIVSAKGRNGADELLEIIGNDEDSRIPVAARGVLKVLAAQYIAIAAEITSIGKSILAWHRSCEPSRRLEEIPGIGPIVATALVAEIADWKAFRSGRGLAAWIGLVPKQHTTGGKDKLGSITKQGNRYLRWLLV